MHYMTLKRVVFIFIAIAFCNSAFSTGRPYFQQQVNYVINVELDDVAHALNGFITIEYINNSPDTLTEIRMHLWPNAYSGMNTPLVKQQLLMGTADLFFAKPEDRGYIDALDFKQDENHINIEMMEVDYGRLILDKPLLPGARTVITTPFHVKIPLASFSRMGHDGQAYYISQWYPKPAVYDKDGWHAMSYVDYGEFYSEYGSFEVKITLPRNYVVCATGECQEKEEVEWLNLKAAESDAGINYNVSNAFPKSEKEKKTITFKQKDIHDFAWFADKRYNVAKGSVELPHSHKRVTTWAFYTNKRPDLWKRCPGYINNTLYRYSLWNGDYLYSQCSVAEGTFGVADGMEYPMVTLVGDAGDSMQLLTTVVHEVGHNWFYGMLGSNERNDPWLDEGINTFNEMRFVQEQFPAEQYGNLNEFMFSGKTATKLFGFENMSFKDAFQLEYNIPAVTHSEQPLNTASEDFNYINYGIIVYRKSAVVFNYLKSYLGDSLFDQCMRDYFDKWKLRHPGPDDLKNTFEKTSGKDLSWFFSDIATTTKIFDYGIKNINHNSELTIIGIENKGGIAGPFKLHGLKNDSVIFESDVEGFTGLKEITVECNDCDEFRIDHLRNTPDVNRGNNSIRTHGIFRKANPVSIGVFPRTIPEKENRFCMMPSVGWNEYNKWMAGLTFYNKFIPVKKFEYTITSMYGFGDKQIAGLGSMTYNIYPEKGVLDYVGVGIKGKRFAYESTSIRKGIDTYEDVKLHYVRWEPNLEFSFRNADFKSTITHRAGVSMVQVFKDDVVLVQRVQDQGYNITGVADETAISFRGWYKYADSRTIDPNAIYIGAEGNNDYQKISAELNYKFIYPHIKKGVELRFFGGIMFKSEDVVFQPFYLNSWSGPQDGWFDELYFGRSEREGFVSQQMTLHDGGFKTEIPYAASGKWLTALNVNVDLPIKLPVSVFFDIGTMNKAKDLLQIYDVEGSVMYDGGICVGLGAVKVYFPLLRSADIKAYQSGDFGNGETTYGEQIRFEVDFKSLNPFYIRNRISK